MNKRGGKYVVLFREDQFLRLAWLPTAEMAQAYSEGFAEAAQALRGKLQAYQIPDESKDMHEAQATEEVAKAEAKLDEATRGLDRTQALELATMLRDLAEYTQTMHTTHPKMVTYAHLEEMFAVCLQDLKPKRGSREGKVQMRTRSR